MSQQRKTHFQDTALKTGLFDYLVFIGRFQPFHVGHKAVIDEALKRAHNVIILIGSANLPRSTRNSFTVVERRQMIKGAFDPDDAARIYCVGLDDALYNDNRWLMLVQQAVKSVTGDISANPAAPKIGLIGHSKDSSSYYLSLFPNWHSVSVANFEGLSATPIRDGYLMGAAPISERVPASTQAVMADFAKTQAYQELQEEAWFIDTYQRQWQMCHIHPLL